MSALDDRLAEIAALPAGWLDGDGEAVTREAIEGARQAVRMLALAGMPKPRLFPTPDGGVSVEWETACLEIEPDGRAFNGPLPSRSVPPGAAPPELMGFTTTDDLEG
jgi:hypothetical protein